MADNNVKSNALPLQLAKKISERVASNVLPLKLNRRLGTLGPYTPPQATTQTIYVHPTTYTTGVGYPLVSWKQVISSAGDIDSYADSDATTVFNLNIQIYPLGESTFLDGIPSVYNRHQQIEVSGSDTSDFGYGDIYNLKQFIGHEQDSDHTLFGDVYLQGGVRYLTVDGFDSSDFGDTQAINTRADQYAAVESISESSIGSPNVSPWYIQATDISAPIFPQPLVQRSPYPLGLDHSSYGDATLWFKVRYLSPAGILSFDSGYPKIFDPTQTVYAIPPQETALFGDVAIKNNRRIIDVSGFNDLTVSQWAELRAKNRVIQTIGVDNASVGNFEIRNATPSLQPNGFVGEFGTAFISSHIRYIATTGFDTAIVGDAQVERTPSFAPESFDATLFGDTWVSNKYRQIYAEGFNKSGFGETIAWHYRRRIDVVGDSWLDVGSQTVTHGVRELIAQGVNTDSFGEPWASFKKRYIEVESISSDNKNSSNHRVSRNIVISPNGFIASLFGERIIPIAQNIYPQSFVAEFGLANVDLKTRYVLVDGFITTFDPIKKTQVQIGQVLVFNKRQYIKQQYDGDNGLVPMPFGLWTAIENRNRNMRVFGFNAAKFGNPLIQNNASPILPDSIKSNIFGVSMIAFSVRRIIGESIDPIPISHWNIINNSARMVSAKGFVGEFGDADIKNTRRYYYRVGNWDSQELGKPMIAYRVRNIDIESRYAITPPYINLPIIENLTNYIEVKGFSADGIWVSSVGSPHLTIHRNIITPRWTLKDYFGEPFIWNKTPEVKIFGHDSAEFGVASLRTQWENVFATGDESLLFGKMLIEFKTKKISVAGLNAVPISQLHKVIKSGSQPYITQYIELRGFFEVDGVLEETNGYGIEPPKYQVANPAFYQAVIYPEGFMTAKFGDARVTANTLKIESGIYILGVANPSVGLKVRELVVKGIDNYIGEGRIGKPRITPHTIYAPFGDEATGQARINNPGRGGFYVNTGVVFGSASVINKNRVVWQYDAHTGNSFGMQSLMLSRQYIQPKGMLSEKSGWHSIPFSLQTVTQIHEDGLDSFQQFGGATVARPPYLGSYTVNAFGESHELFGEAVLQNSIRFLYPVGLDSAAMGDKQDSDNPFMWQGLRIGELVLGKYGGGEHSVFGLPFISAKVRDIGTEGFDTFISEYDIYNFKTRMRVYRQTTPTEKDYIQVMGTNTVEFGSAKITHGHYFIRPDGNSETYRQGIG
nr:hypothetical protein [Moraxella sp.]